VQYEDIGLTLKATPKILRSNDVALTIDLKITCTGRHQHQQHSDPQQPAGLPA
jgi:type II secretory pathway component GspD/PulD (secretin)